MRTIVFTGLLMVIMALFCSCGTSNGLTKAEREVALARQVHDALDTRHYTITVDWIKPLGGMPHHVTSNYELKVNGDELDCYLPYMGEAYRLPYGGGKGLNFKADIQDYKTDSLTSNRSRISFAVNNSEDIYEFRIDVFNNGHCIIDIVPQDRDAISFDGEMIFRNF